MAFCFSLFLKMLFYLHGILPACLSVYHVCPRCLSRPEEGVRSPAAGITDHCELGMWVFGIEPESSGSVLYH